MKIYERFFKESSVSYDKILKIVGRKNEGCAYVVYGTLQGIEEGKNPQQAFIDSCENENYYGDSRMIVEYRLLCATILKNHFNIVVSALKGF